jgi:hypothetical protein
MYRNSSNRQFLIFINKLDGEYNGYTTDKSDKNAPTGLTAAQPAVTPTRPANTPFKVIEISGFL